LTADEIELLQLMSTLVRLSGIDVLEALPVANRIMPPTEPWECSPRLAVWQIAGPWFPLMVPASKQL